MRSFSVVVIAAICSTGCSPRESIQDYVARAEVSPRGVLPPVPESHYDAATYQADGLLSKRPLRCACEAGSPPRRLVAIILYI